MTNHLFTILAPEAEAKVEAEVTKEVIEEVAAEVSKEVKEEVKVVEEKPKEEEPKKEEPKEEKPEKKEEPEESASESESESEPESEEEKPKEVTEEVEKTINECERAITISAEMPDFDVDQGKVITIVKEMKTPKGEVTLTFTKTITISVPEGIDVKGLVGDVTTEDGQHVVTTLSPAKDGTQVITRVITVSTTNPQYKIDETKFLEEVMEIIRNSGRRITFTSVQPEFDTIKSVTVNKSERLIPISSEMPDFGIDQGKVITHVIENTTPEGKITRTFKKRISISLPDGIDLSSLLGDTTSKDGQQMVTTLSKDKDGNQIITRVITATSENPKFKIDEATFLNEVVEIIKNAGYRITFTPVQPEFDLIKAVTVNKSERMIPVTSELPEFHVDQGKVVTHVIENTTPEGKVTRTFKKRISITLPEGFDLKSLLGEVTTDDGQNVVTTLTPDKDGNQVITRVITATSEDPKFKIDEGKFLAEVMEIIKKTGKVVEFTSFQPEFDLIKSVTVNKAERPIEISSEQPDFGVDQGRVMLHVIENTTPDGVVTRTFKKNITITIPADIEAKALIGETTDDGQQATTSVTKSEDGNNQVITRIITATSTDPKFKIDEGKFLAEVMELIKKSGRVVTFASDQPEYDMVPGKIILMTRKAGEPETIVTKNFTRTININVPAGMPLEGIEGEFTTDSGEKVVTTIKENDDGTRTVNRVVTASSTDPDFKIDEKKFLSELMETIEKGAPGTMTVSHKTTKRTVTSSTTSSTTPDLEEEGKIIKTETIDKDGKKIIRKTVIMKSTSGAEEGEVVSVTEHEVDSSSPEEVVAEQLVERAMASAMSSDSPDVAKDVKKGPKDPRDMTPVDPFKVMISPESTPGAESTTPEVKSTTSEGDTATSLASTTSPETIIEKKKSEPEASESEASESESEASESESEGEVETIVTKNFKRTITINIPAGVPLEGVEGEYTTKKGEKVVTSIMEAPDGAKTITRVITASSTDPEFKIDEQKFMSELMERIQSGSAGSGIELQKVEPGSEAEGKSLTSSASAGKDEKITEKVTETEEGGTKVITKTITASSTDPDFKIDEGKILAEMMQSVEGATPESVQIVKKSTTKTITSSGEMPDMEGEGTFTRIETMIDEDGNKVVKKTVITRTADGQESEMVTILEGSDAEEEDVSKEKSPDIIRQPRAPTPPPSPPKQCAPIFEQRLKSFTTNAVGSALFTVKVMSDPEPEVKWIKDGTELKQSGMSESLRTTLTSIVQNNQLVPAICAM